MSCLPLHRPLGRKTAFPLATPMDRSHILPYYSVVRQGRFGCDTSIKFASLLSIRGWHSRVFIITTIVRVNRDLIIIIRTAFLSGNLNRFTYCCCGNNFSLRLIYYYENERKPVYLFVFSNKQLNNNILRRKHENTFHFRIHLEADNC